MADTRASKLRRLDQFRRNVPHVSASALSAVLRECASGNIPIIHSRKDFIAASKQELEERTPYGSLLTTAEAIGKDGEASNMLTINPLALIYKAYAQGGSFTTLMARALELHPCSPESPWRLVVYADEVTPGNPMAHSNKRKIWVFYFSFLEFGRLLLQDEYAWLCNVVKRSVEVNKLSGGVSQLMAIALRLFFGDLTFDLSLGGIVLQSPEGEQVRLFATLSMVLQDGGAHKHIWHCKGDTGSKMCMLCRNLLSRRSTVLGEDGNPLLTCSVIFESELDFATDADIRGTLLRLAEDHGRVTATLFGLKEQACGFKFEPHGVLMDPKLTRVMRPVSQYCHDWMHTVLEKGVFQTIFYLFVLALAKAGFEDLYASLMKLLQVWTLPSHLRNAALPELFSPKAYESHKRAKTFKSSASDVLSIHNIIAVFVVAVVLPWGKCKKEAEVFLALSDLIDMLQAVPLGRISPSMLRTTVTTLLTLCVSAGWTDYMHPKFHWMIHFPMHLERFGCLPSCFAHERKHKMVKRYSNDVHNTLVFERSIIGQVCGHTLYNLSQPGLFRLDARLSQRRTAPAKVKAILSQELGLQLNDDQCHVCVEAHLAKGGVCSKDDVVFVRTEGQSHCQVGQVWLHTEVSGVTLSVVSLWTFTSADAVRGTSDWKMCSEPRLIETVRIVSSASWSLIKPGFAIVIVPYPVKY